MIEDNHTSRTYTDTGLAANTAYQYGVTAVTADGTAGSRTNVTVTTHPTSGDTERPTRPGSPKAEKIESTSATLTWTASSDNTGVTRYRIACSGMPDISVPGNQLRVVVQDLSPSTQYTFWITAQDASGNESESAQLIVVTETDISSGGGSSSGGGGGGGGGGCFIMSLGM